MNLLNISAKALRNSGIRHYSLFTACLILTACCSLGCGGGADGPATYTVSGTVSFDGNPIESGRIQFRSDGGNGQAVSAEITAGAYSLETIEGEMKVEITASKEVPGKMEEAASPDEEPQPLYEMYIPANFNQETTLTAKVTADGENKFPFDLKSKE